MEVSFSASICKTGYAPLQRGPLPSPSSSTFFLPQTVVLGLYLAPHVFPGELRLLTGPSEAAAEPGMGRAGQIWSGVRGCPPNAAGRGDAASGGGGERPLVEAQGLAEACPPCGAWGSLPRSLPSATLGGMGWR